MGGPLQGGYLPGVNTGVGMLMGVAHKEWLG
jgi:hypothetical protein